jgi:hypothetical protein
MDIEVHRAGRTFYAHATTLLNVPHRDLDRFFALPEWPAIAAAKFLEIGDAVNRPLIDFALESNQVEPGDSGGLTGADLDDLMNRRTSGELTDDQLLSEIQALREQRQREREAGSARGVVQILVQETGVAWPVWERSGQELFEAVMPFETGRPTILDLEAGSDSSGIARDLGLSKLALISDYPILTATYGYSRTDYQPNQCRLNPFPAHQDHGGRFPVFVDQVQADALLLSLDANRVVRWLRENGSDISIPAGSDPQRSARALFVRLFDDVPLRETIGPDRRECRMVFGLLHTLSHLALRQASLLCGLDRTSLSEYVLPKSLTVAIYCNHRFGAAIGALTALFEQSLTEWLQMIQDARRCVYDPVCRQRGGNCHACTHLAETSCRFFNLNLGRSFLFGGDDPHAGQISVGFLEIGP